MKTGFFTVWKNYTGKTLLLCSGPVLALYEIVVYFDLHQFLIDSICMNYMFFSWNPYLQTDGP